MAKTRKRPAKSKDSAGRSVSAAEKARRALFKRRSDAAKKGAATRKKRAEARSVAARKGWATRRRKAAEKLARKQQRIADSARSRLEDLGANPIAFVREFMLAVRRLARAAGFPVSKLRRVRRRSGVEYYLELDLSGAWLGGIASVPAAMIFAISGQSIALGLQPWRGRPARGRQGAVLGYAPQSALFYHVIRAVHDIEWLDDMRSSAQKVSTSSNFDEVTMDHHQHVFGDWPSGEGITLGWLANLESRYRRKDSRAERIRLYGFELRL